MVLGMSENSNIPQGMRKNKSVNIFYLIQFYSMGTNKDKQRHPIQTPPIFSMSMLPSSNLPVEQQIFVFIDVGTHIQPKKYNCCYKKTLILGSPLSPCKGLIWDMLGSPTLSLIQLHQFQSSVDEIFTRCSQICPLQAPTNPMQFGPSKANLWWNYQNLLFFPTRANLYILLLHPYLLFP